MSSTVSRSEPALIAYRIGSPAHPLLDGAGAADSDNARWNSRGRHVIYAAEHYATALLEKAAQLNSARFPRNLVYIRISVGASASIEELAPGDLPGWDSDDRSASQAFGDRWYDEERSLVLIVPSLAAPGIERNVLIHGRHPLFAKRVSSTDPEPIRCHPKLLGIGPPPKPRSGRRTGRLASAALRSVTALAFVVLAACGRAETPSTPAAPRPSILLVTLDTTRADAIGPAARGIETPAFNAIAAKGRVFERAYATVPETLPSHISIMTGLYPAGHRVHENGRHLPAVHPVVAARLAEAGYHTAAVVSSFVLARRFGLARGFDVYDDEQPAGQSERGAAETTDRAIALLASSPRQPVFLWVHYFDPHAPYNPPEPFRSEYKDDPYRGEIAAMDRELGRLAHAFEAQVGGTTAVIVVGDHGEGRGDHGESLHGHLAYDSSMRVPLAIAGPGVEAGVSGTPVSIRRVFHTILDWAGLGATNSLRGSDSEVVLGEAMKPFLEYGWLPQTMAVQGTTKAILAGKLEVYDLAADPGEAHNLGAGANIPGSLRRALEDYPAPTTDTPPPLSSMDEEARRRLASLGYVSAGARPAVRANAPRPADMVHLFETIERASSLFVQEQYREAIPLLERLGKEDPGNLDATLRLATAHSLLGQDTQAMDAFRKASQLAPRSPDVRLYLALHYARGKEWPRAIPLLEPIVAETPERLPALEALAAIRERQGRPADALSLKQKLYSLRSPSAEELAALGTLAMKAQATPVAIESFEKARTRLGSAFRHDLELGVLYLAARRFEEARAALDRIPASHPDYPMVLFKRAQVSVLLNEPDRDARIAAARRRADATTRGLIAREKLFEGR